MKDNNIYLIQLNGQINIDELNSNSPFEMAWMGEDTNSSFFDVYTDQSGLIGMLRHLHARGLVLLSITCMQFGAE